MRVMKQYEDGEMSVTEYTKDGESVSHVIKKTVPSTQTKTVPSTQEQTLFETQYQTLLLEMGGMM